MVSKSENKSKNKSIVDLDLIIEKNTTTALLVHYNTIQYNIVYCTALNNDGWIDFGFIVPQ